MITRNYRTELSLVEVGRGRYEILSSTGSLGVIENFSNRLAAERHIVQMMKQKFPETEIVFVNRNPHNRTPHIHDLMRAVNVKKKLLPCGCVTIARTNREE